MGKLIASYEVHCTQCELPFLGIGYRRAEAVRTLRKCGWKQAINDNWYCEKCATTPRAALSPENGGENHG
jgi:hypothetical protein